MTDLDWRDILLHSAGGIVAGFFAHLFHWWPLLVLSAALWTGREVLQRIEKSQPMSHMFSPQVLCEWAAPSVLGPVVYFLLIAA